MDHGKIIIVIPAWNEEKTIAAVVESVGSYGRVLVVNDASTDRTAELAEAAGAEVVSHEVNQGYVGALNTGFKTADSKGADFIITFDADGQHAPENVGSVIEYLEKGIDLVAGIRPFRPRVSEKLFAWTFSLRYGVKDPLCGLKGYRVRIYKDAGFFDRHNTYGADLLRYACQNRDQYKIEQIPVKIYDREDTPRMGNVFRANVRILGGMFRLYFSRET